MSEVRVRAARPVADDRSSSEQLRSTRQGVRTDIQALRAVAVLLVLGYHLAPQGLTGGFVGVDVFFVISGFLITAHLLAHPPTRPADVADFWARRVKRLLPASLVVLAVTLVASRVVAPDTQWLNTAKQASAAALYVINWVLAGDSVDYLAAENAASPVQHFWSLSVEEQFYFVWPVIIGLLCARGLRGVRGPARVALGLGVVISASLVCSVVVTGSSPAAAYFVTFTRAWEFALGGLLAAMRAARSPMAPGTGHRLRATARARLLLGLCGLAAIGWAAVTFTAATPFPGWHALLPTLGALAVLTAALGPGTGWLGHLLAARPVQIVGDLSYAVYLWHWPLIVLLPHVSGGSLGLLDGVAVVLCTFILAGLTKRFVEDPCRRARPSRRRVFAAMAGGIALVLVLAGLQAGEVRIREAAADRALAAATTSGDACLGAGSLYRPECRDKTYTTVVPVPAQARDDKSAAYEEVGGRDCWSYTPRFSTVRCVFGRAGAPTRVALVGNSHAGQWLPTLQALAETGDYEITTFLASRCAMVEVRQTFDTDANAVACAGWVDAITAEIERGDYDLVVLSNRMSLAAAGSTTTADSLQAYQRGYVDLLRTWDRAGVRVLALRDTPAPGDGGIHSMPDCIATHPDEFSACDGPRSVWAGPDPLLPAVRAVGSSTITGVDLNDGICGPTVCRGVVGGVLVYYDGSHLTATYARTLAAPLGAAVRKALSG